MATQTTYQPRLFQEYTARIRDQLKKKLNLTNVNQVPKLEKIVINVGAGRFKEDTRAKEIIVTTLSKISGQHPVETKAKKSIASYKLRQGQVVGYKVTLRGHRMYEFADRLINIVLPRLRDFHGVSHKAFDGQGNYSIGLSDQSVFPELSFEDTAVLHGLQVNFVSTAGNKEHTKALLKAFGLPFEKEKGNS